MTQRHLGPSGHAGHDHHAGPSEGDDANPGRDAATTEAETTASDESWIRLGLGLGPLGPGRRLLLYALAAAVVLGLAWVLFGSTLSSVSR